MDLTEPMVRMLARAREGMWLRGSSEHQLAKRLYQRGLVFWPYRYSKKIQATELGLRELRRRRVKTEPPLVERLAEAMWRTSIRAQPAGERAQYAAWARLVDEQTQRGFRAVAWMAIKEFKRSKGRKGKGKRA
ncbi:MAG TPA: hypothetical protein VMI75_32195 [Polyangiaceae bacterium]|nr:hypothetical protein [Polyangiaceae bacterium]